jgi:hypothetical protein
MDDDPLAWKQAGRICLWRYTEFKRKFDGWHLTADEAGAQSLVALLRALAHEPGAHRTVRITAPSRHILQVPNFSQGRAQWAAPEKWRLSCSSIDQAWEFPATLAPAASLAFGKDYLSDLVTWLEAIPRGEGDFCIGRQTHGNLALWFWWYPKAA